MRFIVVLGLCAACGGPPFVERSAADDAGQALVQAEADPPDAMPQADVERGDVSPPDVESRHDSMPDALTFRQMNDAAEEDVDSGSVAFDGYADTVVMADAAVMTDCTPGTARCDSTMVQTCNTSGQWVYTQGCPNVCSGGVCTGVCSPGSIRCTYIGTTTANTVADLQSCAGDGSWVTDIQCPSNSCATATACR